MTRMCAIFFALQISKGMFHLDARSLAAIGTLTPNGTHVKRTVTYTEKTIDPDLGQPNRR